MEELGYTTSEGVGAAGSVESLGEDHEKSSAEDFNDYSSRRLEAFSSKSEDIIVDSTEAFRNNSQIDMMIDHGSYILSGRSSGTY